MNSAGLLLPLFYLCYENTDTETPGDLKTLYYLDVKPSMAHAAALKQGRYFSLIEWV